MAVIWGTNFTVVKTAFRDLDPQAFNALRMIIASAAFLGVMGGIRLARRVRATPGGRRGALPAHIVSIFQTPARVTPGEWVRLAGLGLVGHVAYQYFFIGGLARSTVANSSLILASTPVVIACAGAIAGHERVGRLHWFGAAVSAFGIYLVVGSDVALGSQALAGDVMTFAAVCCWAAYSLGGRTLMARHSPVAVTGLSMALGTIVYVPLMWPRVVLTDWAAVPPGTLVLLVYSALFALCVAYTIWYVAVRQIGSARTAVYSNLVPIVAMTAAVVFLDEPLDARRVLGAAAVLSGVALTRASGPRSAVEG